MGFRFESLVNNLTFLIPEKFIDPTHIHFKARINKQVYTSGIPERQKMRKYVESQRARRDRIEKKNKEKENQENNEKNEQEKRDEVLVELDEEAPQKLKKSSDKALVPLIMQEEEDDESYTDASNDEEEIDEENDEDDTEQDENELKEQLGWISLDMIVLDKFRLNCNKELFRHLLEIYNISLQQQSRRYPKNLLFFPANFFSDVQSHFLYILRNRTEAGIYYWQSMSQDVRLLEPGKHVSFSFTNPYAKKLLEFRLDGWAQAPGQFMLDEPGEFLVEMKYQGKEDGELDKEKHKQLTEKVKRDVILRIKPKGLKRYVEFIALHKVCDSF